MSLTPRTVIDLFYGASRSPSNPPPGPLPYTLGGEIELELPSGCTTSSKSDTELREAFAEMKQLGFYAAGDCSLSNGVEFKTPPAPLEWHREHVPALLALAKEAGFRHSSRTGLHVHISVENRQPSRAVQSRLASIIHHNLWLLHYYSKRPAVSNYASYTASVSDRNPPRYGSDHQLSASRGAISISYHWPTIEFRLFAGTTDPQQYTEAVELTEALTRYCRLPTKDDYRFDGSAWGTFVSFVDQQKERYPTLDLLLKQPLPSLACRSIPTSHYVGVLEKLAGISLKELPHAHLKRRK